MGETVDWDCVSTLGHVSGIASRAPTNSEKKEPHNFSRYITILLLRYESLQKNGLLPEFVSALKLA
jgi:hypothetical protein